MAKQPKSANGEGGWTQRKSDGRFMARYTDIAGKRQVVYGRTKPEVKQRLRAALKQRDDGVGVIADRRTVGQYLKAWLDTVQPNVQITTYARYEQFVRLHIVPEVGKVPLKRLTPEHLHGLYKAGRAKGMSATSVGHMHTVLHTALQQALRWNYVARNVAQLVRKPKANRREMTTFTADEARLFIAAAAGDRLEALYVIALSTGMRQGEILALRWKDVDLEDGEVRVRGSLQPTPSGLRISEPKTKSSRRPVQLTDRAVAALRRHRVRQNRERLQAPDWQESDFVFADRAGKPIRGSTLLRLSYYPLLERAGLPRRRFHDIRHSVASLLMQENVHAKLVQELLGHSTIAITLDLYSHVTPSMHGKATSAMGRILDGERQSS